MSLVFFDMNIFGFLVKKVLVYDINVLFFWGPKMAINEPKMFMNFSWWVRYAMGKISIKNPHSGVGLAHENLT